MYTYLLEHFNTFECSEGRREKRENKISKKKREREEEEKGRDRDGLTLYEVYIYRVYL